MSRPSRAACLVAAVIAGAGTGTIAIGFSRGPTFDAAVIAALGVLAATA